jgi:hypothetical protein
MCILVIKELALIVIISGEFAAEGLPSVYSAKAKSWLPQI